MEYMFMKCKSLVSIDLSGVESPKLTRINSLFSECTSLVSLQIPNFYMQQLMESTDVFNNVNNLRYIDKILYDWYKKGIRNVSDIQKIKESSTSSDVDSVYVMDDWLNMDDEDEI